MKLPIAPDYSFVQKAAHWLILGLCILQVPTAAAIQRTHTVNFGLKPAPFDVLLHKVHAVSGWTILLLAMVLLALRLFRGAPRLPPAMAAWQRWLAHSTHLCFYVGILTLAVTGTGTMYLSRSIAPLHILVTKIGLGLVALHAAAALWHQFMLRDDLLWRMMPDFRSSAWVSDTKIAVRSDQGTDLPR
jgi:cytochrome b561